MYWEVQLPPSSPKLSADGHLMTIYKAAALVRFTGHRPLLFVSARTVVRDTPCGNMADRFGEGEVWKERVLNSESWDSLYL